MGYFLIRRVGSVMVSLFLVVTLTFFMARTLPAGPFSRERNLPPAIVRNIEARYHLNDPMWKQYVDYLGQLAHGDLGPSFKYPGRTVNDIIRAGFPVSAVIGLLAVLLALAAGLAAGIFAALRHNRALDYLTIILATAGFSVPSFVLAGLLQYYLSYSWGLLPAAQWGHPAQAVMPVLALATLPAAVIARLARVGMLEALGEEYVRTARAKGLPPRVIVWRHALRNAILPVINYMGPLTAGILTGSFVVEYIFAIPGLGRYFVMSVQNRDYTVIIGSTIFYTALLMLMNLLVDVASVIIDPRVRLAGRRE